VFDSAFDRLLSKRLQLAYDCWGQQRALRVGTRHGVWFFDAWDFDRREIYAPDGDEDEQPLSRVHKLEVLARSGAFTDLELSTIRRLAIDRMTISEIAAADGCSRQAVMARLAGNSKGQGGILKKALALQATCETGPS
jgi:hypothetical protein